jgi:hypothetical protein
MDDSALLIRIGLFFAGFVAVMFILNFVLMREWVKRDLQNKGAVPESVRWSWLGPGWEARWSYFGTFYRVRYRDLLGNRHEGWVLVPRASWGKVRWIADNVVSAAAEQIFNLD